MSQEKSFLSKFKIKIGMIALGLDVLTAVLGSFIDAAQIEHVYAIMASITTVAITIISAHSKVDAEAVKLIAAEVNKEAAEISAKIKKRK